MQGWQDWVLYEQDFRRCPVLLGHAIGDETHHICAWPGRLNLALTAAGGDFDLSWQVLEESWVPLPGGDPAWPLDVLVDGQPTPVSRSAHGPQVRLQPGQHSIKGRFRWQRRPEFLQIPVAIGLLENRIDGQPVDHLNRQGNRLWLGRQQAVADAPSSDTAHVGSG